MLAKEKSIMENMVGTVTGLEKKEEGVYVYGLETLSKTINLNEKIITNSLDSSSIDNTNTETIKKYSEERLRYITFMEKLIEKFNENNLILENRDGKIMLK